MASLLELSHELLHNIFVYIEPADLRAVSLTCRQLNDFVRTNRLLFKELYLQRFVSTTALLKSLPTLTCRQDGHFDTWAETEQPDFVKLLKDTERLRRILVNTDLDPESSGLLDDVNRLTTALLSSANPDAEASLTIQFLHDHFQRPGNLERFLTNTHLHGRARHSPLPRPATGQLCARLHNLYGISIDHLRKRCKDTTYPYARAITYDIRGFTDNNMWGPFLDESSEEMIGGLKVDWEKLEAIMIVLGYNLTHFRDHHALEVPWDHPFGGLNGETEKQIKRWEQIGPKLLKEPRLFAEEHDPYGITGTWRRVVCFLDYNDFYLFNFSDHLPGAPRLQPRDPIYREEAIRLITLKLRVTKLESPGRYDNPALPVVHFSGRSQSMIPSFEPNANSAIRG